jgi:hypothetical protein
MPSACVVVVPDARHALPLEAPERLDALVAEFLDTVALRPASAPSPGASRAPERKRSP